MNPSGVRVLAAGSAILFLSIGTRQGFGLLMGPVMADPGLTREQFSLAVATQYLVWGAGGPVAGVLAERLGARATLLAGGALYAVGLLLASLARSSAQFWWAAGLLVGLGLGGASFGVVHAVIARAWPEGRRGWALGIAGAATAAGQLCMLVFTQVTVTRLGWRVALAWHAAAVACIVVAAACLPSGRPQPAARVLASARAAPWRTRAFWAIALPFAASGFQVMATMTHLPAMVRDAGQGQVVALGALVAVSASAFFGQLLFGRLADRWPRQRVLAAVYAARALLSLVPPLLHPGAGGLVVLFVLLGLFWMSPIPLASALTAQVFGTRQLAAVFGTVFLFHQLGGFAGTFLAASLREATGSYDALWAAAALLCAIGGIVTARVRPRARP